MQYYGQDSAASFKNDAAHDATPFDFSINPDTNSNAADIDSSSSSYVNKIGRDALTSLAALQNFFHYHRIGNVGFIGFSGAYQFTDTQKVPKPSSCLIRIKRYVCICLSVYLSIYF